MACTATTQEALAVLRMGKTTLYRLRKEGYLKPGEHYRSVGLGKLHHKWLWDPEAIQRALEVRTRRILMT